MTDFLTWVVQQEPFQNVDSGILPGVELALNGSYPHDHMVKISLADTLLLNCVA